MRDQDIQELVVVVKEFATEAFSKAELLDLVRLDWLQAVVMTVVKAVCCAVVEAWKARLLAVAEGLVRQCPKCGKDRKWKWKSGREMSISLLGVSFKLPNPYVECGHCDAPGVSIVKLLTDLQSGDVSTELELLAARGGALHSYGDASRELEAHHGQEIERTKVRRIALKVEAEAMQYAMEARRTALASEPPEIGPPSGWLTIEADGGKVRTGRLERCQKGDPGYRKKTAKRGTPQRKRKAEWRELITMDVRQPGELQPRCLDVLLPRGAPKGERARRMRAAAIRSGMGRTTRIQGLGDMGSELAPALLAAFPERSRFWLADWTHTRDYVKNAAKMLTGMDAEVWQQNMTDAIWRQDTGSRDHYLTLAFQHRISALPPGFEKCPLNALQTYLRNNWKHMQHRFAQANKLPIVSARAECQVRERTKGRFTIPGAWLVQNLEPKATLRSIIQGNEWHSFCQYVRERRDGAFLPKFHTRIQKAVAQGRVHPEILMHATGPPRPGTSKKEEYDCGPHTYEATG